MTGIDEVWRYFHLYFTRLRSINKIFDFDGKIVNCLFDLKAKIKKNKRNNLNLNLKL